MILRKTQKVLLMLASESSTAAIKAALHENPIGNGHLEIEVHGRIKTIYGGPYLNRPIMVPGVKLAKEILAPSWVDCPIKDFSVPTKDDARRALIQVWEILRDHDAIYVGCMGGWGRTGLFLSLLVKLVEEYDWQQYGIKNGVAIYRGATSCDPVDVVRREYSRRAVETDQQHQFVTDFNVAILAVALPWL